MIIDGLALPVRMLALVQAGRWTHRTKILRERVRAFAPDEDEICLTPIESVRSVAHERDGNPRFWDEYGSLHEIDPTRALIIADFGLGTDAAIALDYRSDPEAVIYMRWAPPQLKPHWVRGADSFEHFVTLLGLG